MDTVFEVLGKFKLHQKLQLVLLMLPSLDIAMHTMSFMFLGRMFDYKCAEPVNVNTTDLNITIDSCTITATNHTKQAFTIDCPNGYNYSEPRDLSFVSEWDLVCGKEALSEVSQTMLSGGQLLGALLFTSLADKFGRKPVYVGCHILSLVVCVGTAFVPKISVFLGMRFLLGALQQGMSLTTCILLMEVLPTTSRALPSKLGRIVWPSCLLVMVLVCYLCRNLSWRHTQLVLSSVSIYCFIQVWLVDESLRWLTVNKKFEKAERIIRKIAKRNGADASNAVYFYREARKLEEPTTGVSSDETQINNSEDRNTEASVQTKPEDLPVGKNAETKTSEPKFSAFFSSWKVFLLTLISCYMWFSNSVAYSGLLMTPTSFADDLYLGFALNVLFELPAAIPMAFVDKLGRRRLAWSSNLLGGLSLLAASILSDTSVASIPEVKTLILITSLVGKFGITLGFAVMWLYTPELFPTTIRSTALGVSSLSARIGGMIAPFSRTLGRYWPWLPGVIFASLCLVNPILVTFLPETHGHELPQTIDDMHFVPEKAGSKQGDDPMSKTGEIYRCTGDVTEDVSI